VGAKVRIRPLSLGLALLLLHACVTEPRRSSAPPDGPPISPPVATVSAGVADSAGVTLPVTRASEAPVEDRAEPAPPRIGVNGEPGDPSSSEKVRAVVRQAGGDPVSLAAEADLALDTVDGVVLTGGKDIDPKRYGEPRHSKTSLISVARDEFDFRLVARIEELEIPTLGICLGAQQLWVARGGTLVQDIPSERRSHVNHRALEVGHPVTLEPRSRLRTLYGRDQLQVASNHHQAPDGSARGFIVAARSPDGLIEAFEADTPDRFLFGLGWHPERNAAELVVFEALVDAAAKRKEARANSRGAAASR
jgi:putative glutamine amidotransferase